MPSDVMRIQLDGAEPVIAALDATREAIESFQRRLLAVEERMDAVKDLKTNSEKLHKDFAEQLYLLQAQQRIRDEVIGELRDDVDALRKLPGVKEALAASEWTQEAQEAPEPTVHRHVYLDGQEIASRVKEALNGPKTPGSERVY